MRFGLDVATAPTKVELPLRIEKYHEKTEHMLPMELLNTTLSRINNLQILTLQHYSQERQNRLDSLYETGRQQNSRISLVIDRQILLERSNFDEKVKQIIQQEERRKREQEELQRKQEEERRRAEKEEQERLKKLENERQKAEEAKQLAQRKAEEDKAKQEAEQQKAEALRKLKEKIQAAKKAKPDVEQTVLKYRQDIKDIKENVVAAMDQNKDIKRSANAIKRKLNVKFGQLSSSRTKMNAITDEVVGLVMCVQNNMLAYGWILNFISKAIVAQAEAEVTVKPSAAIPLANLAVNLLNRLDGLYYYLCARFVKKCAFILGYTCSIDSEEGRFRMGWKRDEAGKWETDVKYEERVGGICSVWAVMARLCTNEKFPFFSMAAEWQFVARMLNTPKELVSKAHYVVFCNWWEAAAEQFVAVYGEQAVKVLGLAVGAWAQYGQSKSYPAATRLTVLGDDYRTRRTFNLIKDMDY